MIYLESESRFYKSFKDVVKLIKMIFNYTNTELGQALNVHQATISRWLQSDKDPRNAIDLINQNIEGIFVDYSNKSQKGEIIMGFSIEFDLSIDKINLFIKPSSKENQPPTSSEQVNEPAVDFNNKDLHKIMLEVMEEATAEDKAVLGKYFIEVLRRYKGR